MTPRAFDDLLDRYGTDLSRWPEPERGPAKELLLSSMEAEQALAALREAELFLRATRFAAGTSGIVATQAMRHRQIQPARRMISRAGWASAGAVALAIGIVVGGFFGPAAHDDDVSFTLAAALGPAETGYVE